jgi:hypothetical protein
MSDILCHREQPRVGQQLTLPYDRKQLILDRRALSEDPTTETPAALASSDFPRFSFAMRANWASEPTASHTRRCL